MMKIINKSKKDLENRTVKNLVEDIITMKMKELMELNFKDMTEEEMTEHDKTYNEVLKLQDKLELLLPNDQMEVVDDLVSTYFYLAALEMEYMFRRGVKMGLNELHFIKEELGEQTILLQNRINAKV